MRTAAARIIEAAKAGAERAEVGRGDGVYGRGPLGRVKSADSSHEPVPGPLPLLVRSSPPCEAAAAGYAPR